MYQKYHVIIKFLFERNTCSDSNFNKIYNYGIMERRVLAREGKPLAGLGKGTLN
jgi:hypothetical protein